VRMENPTDPVVPEWARDLPPTLPPLKPNPYRATPGITLSGKVLRVLNRGICSHTMLLQRCQMRTEELHRVMTVLIALGKAEMVDRKPVIGRTARIYRSLVAPGTPVHAPIGAETYVPPYPDTAPPDLPLLASLAHEAPPGVMVGPSAVNRPRVEPAPSTWKGKPISESTSFYTAPPIPDPEQGDES
jgi:hypothetical protein